jgi:hypothetical protein
MVELTADEVPDDVWTAALWLESGEGERAAQRIVGTGVVIDERRVLTCAHVARRGLGPGVRLWVRLPKLIDYGRRWLVEGVRLGEVVDDADVVDVAVLELATNVPPAAVAPVRFPTPFVLQGKKWWTSGFPDNDGFWRATAVVL